METLPGIHSVSTSLDTIHGGQPAPNVFLIIGNDSAAFIDSGYDRPEEIRDYLNYWKKQNSPKISGIVITHRHLDHMGGASGIRQETNGPIVCHILEKEALDEGLKDSPVNSTVKDGDSLDLGGLTLEFVHSPGHTLGSLCVYIPERKVLFAGDNILGIGPTVVLPEHGDMDSYIKTMRKLLTYKIDAIYPGHGPTVTDPKAKIEGLIKHRLEREKQILSLITKGRCTLDDLFDTIYSDLPPVLHQMAKSQIQSHIIKLENENKVITVSNLTYDLKH